jgi:hypothetical protein
MTRRTMKTDATLPAAASRARYCMLSFALAAAAAAGPLWAADPATPQSAAPHPAGHSAAPPPSTQSPSEATPAQSVAPAGAHSYFVNLHDGQTVTSPFKVVFGLTPNMGVAPSGVEKANVGHHHLLIDTKLTAEEMTESITVDEQHVHFGKGQTETMVTLPPGKHTLQLVLGDWTHVPFNPSVQSDVITVTVMETDAVTANTPPHQSAQGHRDGRTE